MPGPASIPDFDDRSAPAPASDDRVDDSVYVSIFESDARTTASLAAITLPREVVLARRRARRHRLPDLRRVELPLGALGRWSGRLLLALPPLLALAAALWAAATGFGSMLQVLRLVVTLQFSQAAAELATIDAAGRVLLASAGYFALLATLRALVRGLFSRGWARLGAAPGLLLALPSAWLFIAGVELASGAPPLSDVAPDLWRALVIGLALHAIIFAVVGAQPPTPSSEATLVVQRVAPRVAHDDLNLADLDLANAATERLPVVRFGPPLAETPPPETDTQAMRVVGLLHMFPTGDEPSRDEPPGSDAERE